MSVKCHVSSSQISVLSPAEERCPGGKDSLLYWTSHSSGQLGCARYFGIDSEAGFTPTLAGFSSVILQFHFQIVVVDEMGTVNIFVFSLRLIFYPRWSVSTFVLSIPQITFGQLLLVGWRKGCNFITGFILTVGHQCSCMNHSPGFSVQPREESRTLLGKINLTAPDTGVSIEKDLTSLTRDCVTHREVLSRMPASVLSTILS